MFSLLSEWVQLPAEYQGLGEFGHCVEKVIIRPFPAAAVIASHGHLVRFLLIVLTAHCLPSVSVV